MKSEIKENPTLTKREYIALEILKLKAENGISGKTVDQCVIYADKIISGSKILENQENESK